MTRKESTSRDIGLTFDFLRQVVKNPAILYEIPNGSTLEFVEKDFSHLEKPVKTKVKKKYLRVKSELVPISESSLKKDWDRPEEDLAWENL